VFLGSLLIITPNGDDTNQYFVIEGITDHWGLEIFNRLGNRVYQTDAYANNWEARDQPVGLYYYHLRNPYSGQSYKGWLQVLR
jgi:gliding motility-associated-like protein